jgi:GntR family transcriptional regulator/MocR family aminotransferase
MTRPVSSASTLDLGIDRTDLEPLQAQIARQIRDMVLHGRLKPEARVPSSRALAEELGVARATVVEAFEQLTGEGYLETRSGSATRVAAQLPETLLATQPRLRQKPHPSPSIKRVPARPFRAGLVDWEHFPHDQWGKLLGRYWRNPPITLLELNDVFGWPPFRAAVATHLFEWRGIRCRPEQVIVTAGGMDAFDLILRAVLKPRDQIWLEEPGYPTARRVFAQGGVTVQAVPIDHDGLAVMEGRKRAPLACAAFVTPARQYPTGITMPLARRLELLHWARDTDAIIIEDDYDSEYRYVGRPLPSLMSLATSLVSPARVIYSGTFSKVFSPIVRLGFIVVPEDMAEEFRLARASHGAPPSLLVQPALASFMASGEFAIHIRRMRRIYAARRAALIEALEPGHGKLYTLDAAPSGLMLLLRLPPDSDDESIAFNLRSHGVETQTLSSHFTGQHKEQGLLLSFAGFTETDLRASARILLKELQR